MLSTWINIANMGNFVVQIVKEFRFQYDSKLSCYRWEMYGGIRGTADSAVNDNAASPYHGF